jgi:hypothetical protein
MRIMRHGGAVKAADHIQAADEHDQEGGCHALEQMQLAPECVLFWRADRQQGGLKVYSPTACIVELPSLQQNHEVQGIYR